MKSFIASVLLLAPALVLAQATADKPAAAKPAAKTQAAKPAAKAPAKKTTAKATAEKKEKTPVAKATPPSSRTQLKSATSQVATGLIAAEAALTADELAIAERVHTGHIACELGASVNVTPDPKAPGHFRVEGKGFSYYMSPVATSTGVVRLEDQQRGAVWLQIANKSMLMNQKLGQRLADECMSPAQVQVAEAIKKAPPPSLLDAPPAK
ncbi:MAG: hypothetical protein F9K35_03540 [Burkholderiaceae bacterium]|nr:MAG: hypothetical protein F9K35_03540 [Burkholderiaceae bacterium]